MVGRKENTVSILPIKSPHMELCGEAATLTPAAMRWSLKQSPHLMKSTSGIFRTQLLKKFLYKEPSSSQILSRVHISRLP